MHNNNSSSTWRSLRKRAGIQTVFIVLPRWILTPRPPITMLLQTALTRRCAPRRPLQRLRLTLDIEVVWTRMLCLVGKRMTFLVVRNDLLPHRYYNQLLPQILSRRTETQVRARGGKKNNDKMEYRSSNHSQRERKHRFVPLICPTIYPRPRRSRIDWSTWV